MKIGQFMKSNSWVIYTKCLIKSKLIKCYHKHHIKINCIKIHELWVKDHFFFELEVIPINSRTLTFVQYFNNLYLSQMKTRLKLTWTPSICAFNSTSKSHMKFCELESAWNTNEDEIRKPAKLLGERMIYY